MKRSPGPAIVPAAALALAACTVGPNFIRPAADASAAYGAEPSDVASRTFGGAVDAAWWRAFRDPELTSLVDRLARQNLDLQAAAERVQQARAARSVAASQGRPRVDGQAQYQRERLSKNGTTSLLEPTPGAPLEFDIFRPMANASWELDLFGRVRRAVEAADAQTRAAVEARRGLALSAVAELAQSYCQLRALQAQEAILRRNLVIADRRRALVRDRFAQGVATTLEVAQVDAQGLAVAQDLPSLLAQEAQAVNAIGLLLAEQPRALSGELSHPAAQPLAPPAVPVGLPAELARRRPDIREAEERLHAATAQTGVAVASFYPDISLSGGFGFESLKPSTLFDWASRQFMAGPSVDLPIFEGGRLKGTLRLREAQQREAAIDYRRTVLQAFRDVDDALTGYAQAQRTRVAAAGTRDADRRALAAADQQYAQGQTSLLDVISAQEATLQGENAVAQAQMQLETRLIELYKALGGGWELAEPAPPSNQPSATPETRAQ